MLRLISASPSPFARKARVALIEKGIPFETVLDVPWDPDTVTQVHNPLAQAPVLILENEVSVYDSRVIVEYLEELEPEPRLIPEDPAARIAHKQVEALADGVCDAAVLVFLERLRPPEHQGAGWIDRQLRKIRAGTAEADRLLGDGDTVVATGFGLADVAVGCMLGYLDLRLPDVDWRGPHPALARLADRLAERPSFRDTLPEPQTVPSPA
jgi:glutathione S-transferase